MNRTLVFVVISAVLALPVRGLEREKVSGPLEEREVVEAAKRFVGAQKAETLRGIGLAGSGELRYGKPVELYELSMEKVQAWKKGPLTPHLAKTGSWYVPVEDANGVAVLAQVGCCSKEVEGRLVGQSVGSSTLATKWLEVKGRWPDARLVSCPPGPATYYVVPSLKKANLTPMTSFEKGVDLLVPADAAKTLAPLKAGRYPGLGAAPQE
ncbi:MAG: hypothetical protein WC969_04665 [Elusimicrobiota bacterium]|jgi:hypothetical protein